MPVSAIFENPEAGAIIDDIMEWFDGLDREQVKAVIEFAARSLDKPTAAQQGRDRLGNGDLLTAAEEPGFDLLLTTDKNMRCQQNLAGRKIAIVALGQQQWPILLPHVRSVIDAVGAAAPGSYTEVEILCASC